MSGQMARYFGVQLALELTNVFPVKDIVNLAGEKLLTFARDLRKSGSDIVVEADLAEVFGRGRISDELDHKFRNAIKTGGQFVLATGSEIELSQGPGPTIINALHDRRHFATVIQLSFLAWTHDREQLATMLTASMRERYEQGVHDASPDPGYEGVINTLAACSSQTCAFDWSRYTTVVKNKLEKEITGFQYSGDYIRISPALFLGAMDCLYMVQTLPEDRKIIVSNETGIISLTVWAHYILGLNVIVTGKIKTPITFGSSSCTHVTIQWTQENAVDGIDMIYPYGSNNPEPELLLLDSEMNVVLKVSPDNDRKDTITADDRHPLQGWGREYMERLLNTNLLISSNDPIYKEMATLSIALSIYASERLVRETPEDIKHELDSAAIEELEQLHSMSLEHWRVYDAGSVIFDGINIDRQAVNSYTHFVRTTELNETTLPVTFKAFLQKVRRHIAASTPAERFLEQVYHLAETILTFAYVADIKSCANMPLRMFDDNPHMHRVMNELQSDRDARPSITSRTIFHSITDLLCSASGDVPSSRAGFLQSDFGWSVFFDTVGDKDPTDVRPELIHIRRGTPTNTKTGERKLRLRDGSSFTNYGYPRSHPVLSDFTCVPRCAAKVTKRREMWTSRRNEFELVIFFTIDPSPEWRAYDAKPTHMLVGTHYEAQPISTFEEIGAYGAMQEQVWYAYSTSARACSHSRPVENVPPITLGPDAVALLGWNNAFEGDEPLPQRILVYLTRGDPRIRWSAVLGFLPHDSDRRLMLRSKNCCDNCALEYTASQQGRWILVL